MKRMPRRIGEGKGGRGDPGPPRPVTRSGRYEVLRVIATIARITTKNTAAPAMTATVGFMPRIRPPPPSVRGDAAGDSFFVSILPSILISGGLTSGGLT